MLLSHCCFACSSSNSTMNLFKVYKELFSFPHSGKKRKAFCFSYLRNDSNPSKGGEKVKSHLHFFYLLLLNNYKITFFTNSLIYKLNFLIPILKKNIIISVALEKLPKTDNINLLAFMYIRNN